jgi:hypothetical protein
MGRGPFAPAANGLVKIGETMTLVVTVEGDPGFDIQVRRIHYVQQIRLYSVLNMPLAYEADTEDYSNCYYYILCKLIHWHSERTKEPHYHS